MGVVQFLAINSAALQDSYADFVQALMEAMAQAFKPGMAIGQTLCDRLPSSSASQDFSIQCPLGSSGSSSLLRVSTRTIAV
jgi:hypothetical protein